jgi:hypothetical protein
LALRDDLASLGLEPQWGAARAAEWWSAHPPEASTPDPAAAERAAWAARQTLALGAEVPP